MYKITVTVIDILEASVYDCLVTAKETGDVLYHGDSSYMANQAYAMAMRNNLKPVYEKKRTLLVPVSDRPKHMNGKDAIELYRELIKKVPERVQNIYAKTIAKEPVDAATIALAQQFHPEYFQFIKE